MCVCVCVCTVNDAELSKFTAYSFFFLNNMCHAWRHAGKTGHCIDFIVENKNVMLEEVVCG